MKAGRTSLPGPLDSRPPVPAAILRMVPEKNNHVRARSVHGTIV
jgi:hypothetical protein